MATATAEPTACDFSRSGSGRPSGNQIKSNIFDNTKKQNKQTDENEEITTKCIQKNSKTTC